MDDTAKQANGKHKLPPITTGSNGDAPPKPVRKKKKKPPAESSETTEENKPKAKPKGKGTPRKKKAAASASTTEGEGGEQPTPKKKKRTPRKTDGEEGETSARSAASQGEDVTGSKASLLSKGTKGGTPRKKKVKKKVKKTPTEQEGDEYFDSTLAADLTEIEEDVVTEKKEKDEDEDEDYSKKPYSTGMNFPSSQPTRKLFIETDGGFKGQNKSKFAKQLAEKEKEKEKEPEAPVDTTIAFALATHKVLRTFFLFCHGLLAGISVWHIVMSYVFQRQTDLDFLELYKDLALPVQCMYYILLAACTVSAFDRFDIGHPTRKFFLQAVTLQNGTISAVVYLAALVLSLSVANLEDRMNLFDDDASLWTFQGSLNETLTNDSQDKVTLWRGISTARGVLAILGWFIISITPVADRLADNLQKTDDDILGDDVELTKNSMA